jgi:hypothetical protein
MRYYTYENWRAKGHTAKIHVGVCWFCKDGKGMGGGTRADNGKWHGPFDTLQEARAFVRGVEPDTHTCART